VWRDAPSLARGSSVGEVRWAEVAPLETGTRHAEVVDGNLILGPASERGWRCLPRAAPHRLGWDGKLD
jgi:hypothetical protein